MSTFIHPTALVSPTAQLDLNVKIGPFCVIDDNVIIGSDTSINSFVQIGNNTHIGKECQIFQGSVVGEIPQDLKYDGEDTQLIIGDRTRIREFCTINKGTKETRDYLRFFSKTVDAIKHICLGGQLPSHRRQKGGHLMVSTLSPAA